MNSDKINAIFQTFNQLNVLIIGDVMVDSYMWGKVERISPEAPVPVVAVNKKENRLGGAANVALNIVAMGATPFICSVIGEDEKGNVFIDLLKTNNLSAEGIIKSKNRQTTVKTRVIGSKHQMLRVDEEMETEISENEATLLQKAIISILNSHKIDVIIFEDYDKGTLVPKLIEKIVSEANKRNIPTAVDPKKKNFYAYKKVSLFKPNLKELKEGLKIDLEIDDKEAIKAVAENLRLSNEIKMILLTLSDQGIYFCTKNKHAFIPAHVRDISDVSGAGDTVISVAALCLATGLSSFQIATLSNLAGGLVCEKVGVVPIDKIQLMEEALLIVKL